MSEIEISVNSISKIYKLYNNPKDRFKEAFSVKKTKYYNEFFALRNLSFEIKRGETIGIVGKNGSGKSTLLKILTGVISQSRGEVFVKGKISALLELGAGFNMEYTGIENIFLYGTIMNIKKVDMEKKVDDIIKFADIGDYINQPVKMYSSGMFVRLAFAVAINVDPDILIVDEALAVGDIRFQLKCMDKFVEFMEKGKTIIFVSHDVNSIKRFCNRVLWINNGELIMDGETDTVIDDYLDFLKTDLDIHKYFESKKNPLLEENDEKRSEDFIEHKEIASIKKIDILNKKGETISEIVHGEDVRVVIDYDVVDLKIKEPVIGLDRKSVV